MFKRVNIIIFLVALIPTIAVFRQFFFNGSLPIPADIITAGYYPWADSSWGYSVKVPIKNSLPSDVPSLLYPWRTQALEILKSGHLPLWDNTILLGTPLLANFQAALLNPANILFFVLPQKLAWSWQVILQLPLLFLATFLFLRNLKLSRPAAVFGALSFSLSGQVLVWLEYNSLVYTLVYFPLVLLLVDKIVARPRIWLAAVLGLVLSFQLFSGYPLNTFYTLAFCLMYFLWRVGKRGFRLSLGLIVLGIATGLAGAAVQLIPGQELAAASIRSFDQSAQAADIKYLPFAHLFSFFAPDLFGNSGTQNYWSTGSFDNFAFFIPTTAGYFFLLSLVTKIAFKRENFIFLGFAAVSLVWALANPLSRTLENFKFIGLDASVNARVLFIFSFAASVLAALAFEHTLKNKVLRFVKVLPLTVFITVIIAFFVAFQNTQKLEKEIGELAATNINPSAFFTASAEDALHDARLAVAGFKIGLRNTVIPTTAALVTFILVLANLRRLNTLFIPLLALAVLPTFDKYLSFTRADLVFPETPVLTKLVEITGSHRFEREKAEILPANTWSVYGLSSPSGQNVVAPLSTVRYLDMINRGKLDDRLLTRFMHVDNTKSPLFDTLDVATLAYLDHDEKTSVPHKDGRPYPWILPDNLEELANVGTIRIFKNTNNLGPAWFPENTICEHNLDKSAQVLTSQGFNPGETAVVACTQGIVGAQTGIAELVEALPNSVSYKASTSGGNYLILSRANFPGWRTYIDGTETSLQAANIGLTAVYVPAGEHKVELKYEPLSVKVGAAISAATLGAWAFVLMISYLFHSLVSGNIRRGLTPLNRQ